MNAWAAGVAALAVGFGVQIGNGEGTSALAQDADAGIRWEASRPLEWADFRARVDPDASPRTAALAAVSISLGYELAVSRGRGCSYEITAIETSAEFHPDHSWVRDEARTAAILEHEQGHFDLAEIFRVILAREARPLVGASQRCPERDDMAAVEAEVGERIGQIRERIFAELERVQAEYDAQTGHGTLAAPQREWTARIAAALRRGAW